MRILFIVPYAPNLVRVRPYNVLKALAGQGHDVILATLWEGEEEREGLGVLEAAGIRVLAEHHTKVRALANCLGALPGRDPLQAHYCWNSKLNAQCTRLNAQGAFDVVHVEHLRGARYGLAMMDHRPWTMDPSLRSGQAHGPRTLDHKPWTVDHGPRARGRVPVVWDSVDCISHLFEQAARHGGSFFGKWVTRFELGRTRRCEGRLVHEFDRVLVTSPVDREALERLGREYPPSVPPAAAGGREVAPAPAGERITVLPNGVDLEYFCPTAEPREPATLVFSGKMSYHANVAAVLHLAQDILPRIRQVRPEVRLWIVGKDPTPEVRRLAGDGVEVTGTVPDLRPYLRRAEVAVVPTVYGAGIQNKVLEAMACCTPVVASAQACSALSAEAGADLLVASEPQEFADAVLALLRDSDRRETLGTAGRRYVEREHDWSEIGGRLVRIYDEAAGAPRGAAAARR